MNNVELQQEINSILNANEEELNLLMNTNELLCILIKERQKIFIASGLVSNLAPTITRRKERIDPEVTKYCTALIQEGKSPKETAALAGTSIDCIYKLRQRLKKQGRMTNE